LITAIYLIIALITSKKNMLELQQRNHETELSFLRSQVQPHFFFNTLNNLYSLTLEKSEKAPETVLKLSELMSYVIYKGKDQRVNLTEEIEHINNYIDLENLRFGNKLEARLSISGDVGGKQLPPLILMPFVENSFKHGIHYRNGKILIQIDLEVVNNDLIFTTKNPVGPSENARIESKELSGIGIQNTKRRLELLYGNAFCLEVNRQSDYFLVTLKIKLYEN
jgi:LytS/YehU family sensor histidine kinase